MRTNTNALARAAGAAFVASLVLGSNNGIAQSDDLAKLAALEAKLGALEQEIQLLEDSKAIKRLQRAYGYYLDHVLAEDLAGLFAQDGTVELGQSGVYVGQPRVAEY